jgi:osmotically-inducible protein OsmY
MTTDKELQDAVERELLWEPRVHAEHIGVSVNNARAALNHLEWNVLVPNTVKVQVTDGWLTLKGVVKWQYQKEEAERAVRSLMGVKTVVNEITVKPSVSAVGVKSKIEDAFKRSAEIDAGHIKVEASGGTVTLRGHVRAWVEREEAERVAWAAPGVTNVQDLITIS